MPSTTTVRPVPRVFACACSLAAVVALSGCADTPAVVEPTQRDVLSPIKQQTRVIVKFNDPTLDPARQDYLKELARDTGVTLVYIRPMSGGAHVLQVEDAMDAGHFQRIVDRLAKKPGVEYVEADRRMRPMPQY